MTGANDRSHKITEAGDFLGALNFDAERCNQRSSLVLLALLDLVPDRDWSQAADPSLRTVAIIEWIETHYDVHYAPNTRETIRRQTLHQFIEAALVVENPDEPLRPVNSPKWCYQISSRALDLAQRWETPAFAESLREYLKDLPGLRARYGRARELQRIPVVLPDGGAVTLSPGGQNMLIKEMVEVFCGYFTPDGRVLYIGDAGDKWMSFAEDEFHALGVQVDQHGKMPDLVVHMPDRNWLVLLEAASSHGPVDGKRRGELASLFAGSTAGLVYVSCFPSRDEMRKYLSRIAWESEVWCADNPTHLIHFDGERFLGPYES